MSDFTSIVKPIDMKKQFLPELPLEMWEATQITLHLWMQIVGKIKLAVMPPQNHWWHITFRLSTNGLTTGPMPHPRGTFEIEFDFVNHQLLLKNSWGDVGGFKLVDGMSVAQFHDRVFEVLKSIEVYPKILGIPYDHPCEEPFADCETHHTYQSEWVNKFFQVLVFAHHTFTEFNNRFSGKVSPVQLFWHHLDMAVARFSGDRGPFMPDDASLADQVAYSHEVFSAGFWSGDENVRAAAFYAYMYPAPQGMGKKSLKPQVAYWQNPEESPMAMLMYDDLLKSDDPKADLLDFLQSSFEAGSEMAGWSGELLADPSLID